MHISKNLEGWLLEELQITTEWVTVWVNPRTTDQSEYWTDHFEHGEKHFPEASRLITELQVAIHSNYLTKHA